MFEQGVQRTFEAVNQKDLVRVMRGWAQDGVLEFPGHSTLSGRYEGKAAIEGFFRRWFDRMETIHLTVRRVGFSSPALTYNGTMYVEFETDQTTNEGTSFHTDVIGVYRMRRGKLVTYREFLFDLEGADAIWGPADETRQPASGAISRQPAA
jgi:ketosteroid isomerase-like protein